MRKVVKPALAFARNTDLDVVAEGVEAEAPLGALRFEGCPTVQGYLTGRKMSATALRQHLRLHHLDGPLEALAGT